MDKPKFMYVIYMAATSEALWKAITTAGLIEKFWFGRLNTSEWKADSTVESRSPQGELEWRGKVLSSDPPRFLQYTFEALDVDEPPSRVTFEVVTLGKGTKPQGRAVRLTVTHDEFPRNSKVYQGICEGWPAILSSLKSLLETGRSLDLTWKE